MNKTAILLCIITLSFLAFGQEIIAFNEGFILINEIAWMGTTNSANDEWIEIKNNSGTAVDISGWILKSPDDKIKINLKGKIEPNSFLLLERTDDSSVPEIKADIIYKGSLNNSGTDLFLYDSAGKTIDSANFTSGWTKGDNEQKRTMERVGNDGWQTSKNSLGTPKKENSSGFIKTEPTIAKTLPESKKIDNKDSEDVLLAATKESLSQNNSPSAILLISLLLIIVSGGIILFLKFKK